ncbi:MULTISPECIES: serine/threonine-protein kinase [Kitasatospora]|uniref:non-specific serine/threonine protein kinase n=1 Tax=Kitasatospora setae (strain ATCC 33774 / DSM 43861 / JCM 3304 / KCC A-0304 / NBRC 14216 / KM-6054) TaxID=452652 RepID=E4NIB3_KITSK|nr:MULTISPECIES: serine/threonine-protein kinase [Kitasatospora]BAJ31243.1 putative serine/threonine protein kinase [Kitasatospora setae KM-6054]
MAEACARTGCTGEIDTDGYCDECGLTPERGPAAAPSAPVPAPRAAVPAGGSCGRAGCAGTIDPDGYCDECGLTAATAVPAAAPPAQAAPSASASVSAPVSASASASTRSRSGRSGRSARSGSVSVRSAKGGTGTARRGNLGAGLVAIAPVPSPDPALAVLADPQVPEHKRFCSRCEQPVGREQDGRPGRPEGFCVKCGTPYSFSPKLSRGDLVGGQYEVMGCLAHGGLGWIYLAVDRRVNDRWVVLKGLLDTGDEDALAVAIAERRFLAEVDHPNIVRIINFVEHPDARTGAADGYIVMEYVGGKSLKDIANERRAPDGRREPLPVEQALAYGLAALPALGYLHARGLVYCDFKLDNVIQSDDMLKIIDMGAVRRHDDDGPIYGTVGYQAPEIATTGPSPASDLYTVARTLAVMTFDFRGYTDRWRHELPGPDEVEVFARYESFHRLLVRATDPDPARRFASAEEMAGQLTGVLREVLSLQDGQARPAPSTLFGPELRIVDTELAEHAPDPRAAALALPGPLADPADPKAGLLSALSAASPAEALAALSALAADGGPDSTELRLRLLRTHLELADPAAAAGVLAGLEADHPGEWRVVWHRGLLALAEGRAEEAAESFEALYDAFPGEAAPKLALAVCAELLGDHPVAAGYYALVNGVDRSFVGAAFGLARVRLADGDRAGAVAALEAVPETSAHWTAARIGAVRARLRGRAATEPLAAELADSSERLAALTLDARRREELAVEVLDSALNWVLAGAAGRPATLTVLGHPAAERELRLALEHSYRMLARLSDRAETRIEWVERANRARPRTWV